MFAPSGIVSRFVGSSTIRARKLNAAEMFRSAIPVDDVLVMRTAPGIESRKYRGQFTASMSPLDTFAVPSEEGHDTTVHYVYL